MRPADHYTIELVVTLTAGGQITESTRVLVDPTLHPGWPQNLGLFGTDAPVGALGDRVTDHMDAVDVNGDGAADLPVGYGQEVRIYDHTGAQLPGSGTPIQKATQYAYEQFAAWNLSPSFHAWSSGTRSGRNVVAERAGTSRPGEIVLLGGHLDDMPSGGVAPGADDNASGSVGVLVAAQILLQQPWERTLRFVLFTGEEQGLLGSAAYAAMVRARGDNIVAVLNLDMIAWNTLGSSPTARLHTRIGASGQADQAIAQTMIDVVTTYGLGSGLQPMIDADGIGASDHASFWNQGYPGILAIEDDSADFNPQYHTVNDRLSTLDLPCFATFVKASLGSAAHLAVYADLIFVDGFE